MKNQKFYLIIAVSLSVAVGFFYLSFTEFSFQVNQQDVVSGEQVFVTTDETAVDNFINELENESPDDVEQAFGVVVFVDFRDSNGNIIPKDTSFLNIPLSQTYLNTASLIGDNDELLDFAEIQLDILGLVTKETQIDATVEFEVLSNDKVFLSGVAEGKGMTSNKKINMDFTSGEKTGEVIELSFKKNEIPFVSIEGQVIRNELQVRITEVSAFIGSDFDTKFYNWAGSFPIYTVRYDADPSTRTVLDYTGKAITKLPADTSIQTCGHNFGRVHYTLNGLPESEDTPKILPKISVRDEFDRFVLSSSNPQWGNRDADFDSIKCGNIVGGLERNTKYKFTVTTNFDTTNKEFEVITPEESFNYKAECENILDRFKVRQVCTSNFGWSR